MEQSFLLTNTGSGEGDNWTYRPKGWEEPLPEPVWWTVRFEERQAFVAVHATSTQVVLEKSRELIPDRIGRLGGFLMSLPLGDEQQLLTERYDGQEAVRLIPMSYVEWPESIDSLTDEQERMLGIGGADPTDVFAAFS